MGWVLALSIGTALADAAPPPTVVTDTDMAVWRTVLARSCQRHDGHFSVLSTRPVRPAFPASEYSDAAHREAVTALDQRIAVGAALPLSLQCAGVRVMAPEAIVAAVGQVRAEHVGKSPADVADRLDLAMPGAAEQIDLSLPGYTADRRLAVVYMAAECGRSCGSAGYYFLRRQGDHWQMTESLVRSQ